MAAAQSAPPPAARPWAPLHQMPDAVTLSQPWIRPTRFQALTIDLAAMQDQVSVAPLEDVGVAALLIELPDPDGGGSRFNVREAPLMALELAVRHPAIRTYVGQGVDDPAATLRMDLTPLGFHAQVLSPRGAWYIDPFSRDDVEHYSSYYKRDLPAPADWSCETKDAEIAAAVAALAPASSGDVGPRGGTITRRTFRTAIACTGEYAQFHGGSRSDALAAIVTTLNRVTGIYEREVAVRFQLVGDNDDVVFTNRFTDPYWNGELDLMTAQNQATLDTFIGPLGYDIGHVFGTGPGGVAFAGVCVPGAQGRAVSTSGSPNGDAFYVNIVAHEMAHQFGAQHTFNGEGGVCGANRAAASAYEPGSGSTILSYAGTCASDDVQGNKDPYFHSQSLEQIRTWITSPSGLCASTNATSNHAPSADAGPDYTIPFGTPFTLSGGGSDLDGDALSYSWEQRDLGPQGPWNASDDGLIPLVRSRLQSGPSRDVPLLGVVAIGERVPTAGRAMHWRLTTRDNRADGGATGWDEMTVNVTTTVGPFRVTSQSSPVVWAAGSAQTVTWDVNGTDAYGMDCTAVDILFSVDGGNTFPYPIAANVPNDGRQYVGVPPISTTRGRVRVQIGMSARCPGRWYNRPESTNPKGATGMMNSNVFVGIDYATAFVQVCVLDSAGKLLGNKKIENDRHAIAEYVAHFGTAVRAGVEACGGTADLAEQLMQHDGWSIDLAHPGYVQRLKQSPDKTDYSDARLLADLVRVGYLPRVWLAPPCIRELRRLVRYRQSLVDRRRTLKQKIGALLRDLRCTYALAPWTLGWIQWLRDVQLPEQSRWIVDQQLEELDGLFQRIAAAEQRLAQVTAEDRLVKRMLEIKGIGLVTACVLRAEIGDPTRFRSGKQLARFCGLSPQNASSGERQADAGLIVACNRPLRATLMEAAHRLKRFDVRWAKLAHSLKQRGKPGSVIAAAVANRWMRGLYHDLVALQTAA